MTGSSLRKVDTLKQSAAPSLTRNPTSTMNWFLVGLAYTSLFTFGLVDNVRGPVFPDILSEYGLSDLTGGFFFLIASGASLVNNLLFARWMERIGAYRTTQVYSVAQIAGLLLYGVATTYPMTLLGSVLLGMSLGGLGFSVNVLVAEGSPPDRRRQALSGLHCMYGVSSLFAPLLVSEMYRQQIGWRGVLSWMALGPLLAIAYSFFKKVDDRPLAYAAHGSAGSASKSKSPWLVGAFFGSLGAFYVIAEIAISTRLVLFARRDWSLSVEEANWLLSLYFVGLFVGRFAAAVVRLPWRSQTILLVSTVLGLLFFVLGLTVHPGWMAATGLPFSVFYPVLIAMINDEHGPHSGYITSWCITLQSFGVMVMHFALGGLTDLYGLGSALWAGPLVLLLVLIFLGVKSRVAPPLEARV